MGKSEPGRWGKGGRRNKGERYLDHIDDPIKFADYDEHREHRGCVGRPPLDHPRRCKGKSRNTGEQCKAWALVGSDYCLAHGGHTRSNVKGVGRLERQTKWSRMARRFYSKFLGPTLKERFLEACEDAEERLDLLEEVGVARTLCSQALALASVAFDDPPEGVEQSSVKIDEETKCLAISNAREAIEHVSRIVERAHKLSLNSREFISVKQIDLLVTQMCKLMHDVLGDEHLDKAKKIETAFRDELRLPEDPKADPLVRVDVRVGYDDL